MILKMSEIWRVGVRVWIFVTSLIFPQRCPGCNVVGVALCEMCERKLEGVFVNGGVVIDGFRVFFACGQSEILRKVLHRFKYVSDEALTDALAALLVRRMRYVFEDMGLREVDRPCVFVPVPLHRQRERERGFNQSAMLAKVIARAVGGTAEMLLERCRATDVQARLSRNERLENVRGAFRLRDEVVESGIEKYGEVPDTVFVVDDVITTGSTFIECARVLKRAGAANVYGIMLAHGL